MLKAESIWWAQALHRLATAGDQLKYLQRMFGQAFKNVAGVFWKETGCTTTLDYPGQTAWLLFPKYLEGLDQDRAGRAELHAEIAAVLENIGGLP